MSKLRKVWESTRGEVLVAIMRDLRDFAILYEYGWYRIPVDKAPKPWPPQCLAFYQTKVFGDDAFTVRYFGRVGPIEEVARPALFPDEPPNPKTERVYYRVHLEEESQVSPVLYLPSGDTVQQLSLLEAGPAYDLD